MKTNKLGYKKTEQMNFDNFDIWYILDTVNIMW